MEEMLDILDSVDISTYDKLETAVEKLSPILMGLFACDCVERSLINAQKLGYKIDTRSFAGIEAKRKWLKGALTLEELNNKFEEARLAVDEHQYKRGLDVYAQVAASSVTYPDPPSPSNPIFLNRSIKEGLAMAVRSVAYYQGIYGRILEERWQVAHLKNILQGKVDWE